MVDMTNHTPYPNTVRKTDRTGQLTLGGVFPSKSTDGRYIAAVCVTQNGPGPDDFLRSDQCTCPGYEARMTCGHTSALWDMLGEEMPSTTYPLPADPFAGLPGC